MTITIMDGRGYKTFVAGAIHGPKAGAAEPEKRARAEEKLGKRRQ